MFYNSFAFFHREIFEVRGPIFAKFCHTSGRRLKIWESAPKKNLRKKYAKFGVILLSTFSANISKMDRDI